MPDKQPNICRDEICKHSQKQPHSVILISTNKPFCSFASEWPVTDCLSLAGVLEKKEWIVKGAVRKMRFNRGGSRGNGFNKAATLQKRMSTFQEPLELD